MAAASLSELSLWFQSARFRSRKPPIFRVILSCHEAQRALSLPSYPPTLFLQKTRKHSDRVITSQPAGTRGPHRLQPVSLPLPLPPWGQPGPGRQEESPGGKHLSSLSLSCSVLCCCSRAAKWGRPGCVALLLKRKWIKERRVVYGWAFWVLFCFLTWEFLGSMFP